MRTSSWVLLPLLLALAAPLPAQAQDQPMLRLLDDSAGDVALAGAPTPTVMPAGTADDLDLVSLDVGETPLDFLFKLGVKDLASGSTTVVASGHDLFFRHHDQDYGITFYPGGSGYAYLYAYEPGEGFGAYVADLPVTMDLGASTMTATVRRDLLIDNDGAAPHPGRILDNFHATTNALGNFYISGQSATPHPEDRMPNDGVGPLAWPVQYGIQQSGHLRLSSEEPFRASNGEASTFVFRINATNLAEEDDLVEFVAQGVPQAWDVQLPGLTMLDANQSVEFPVIVRTAFAHQHGSATAFTLELVSQNDASAVGRIELGLRYPLIAQPAGHHDTVYFHSVDQAEGVGGALDTALKLVQGGDFGKRPYFNTAAPDDDPQDDAVPVTGYTCGLNGNQDDIIGTRYCWSLPLGPGLQMGLDFDLNRTGTYSIPMFSLLPHPGARVEGELVYLPPYEGAGEFNPETGFVERQSVVVATLNTSERADIGANAGHTFTGIITPTPDGDFLPYLNGAGLMLELRMLSARPDNPLFGPKGEPELRPGGTMTLPLLDYEDPLGETFGDDAKLQLALAGDMQRMANPGATVVYNATLTNADNQTHTVALLIIGSNREWATLPGGDELRLEPGESATLRVAVVVPLGAVDEDRADLVLDVASTSELSARALVRMVTTVDTDAEHADDAALVASAQQGGKDTSAPAFTLTLAALAALVLVRRRR